MLFLLMVFVIFYYILSSDIQLIENGGVIQLVPLSEKSDSKLKGNKDNEESSLLNQLDHLHQEIKYVVANDDLIDNKNFFQETQFERDENIIKKYINKYMITWNLKISNTKQLPRKIFTNSTRWKFMMKRKLTRHAINYVRSKNLISSIKTDDETIKIILSKIEKEFLDLENKLLQDDNGINNDVIAFSSLNKTCLKIYKVIRKFIPLKREYPFPSYRLYFIDITRNIHEKIHNILRNINITIQYQEQVDEEFLQIIKYKRDSLDWKNHKSYIIFCEFTGKFLNKCENFKESFLLDLNSDDPRKNIILWDFRDYHSLYNELISTNTFLKEFLIKIDNDFRNNSSNQVKQKYHLTAAIKGIKDCIKIMKYNYMSNDTDDPEIGLTQLLPLLNVEYTFFVIDKYLEKRSTIATNNFVEIFHSFINQFGFKKRDIKNFKFKSSINYIPQIMCLNEYIEELDQINNLVKDLYDLLQIIKNDASLSRVHSIFESLVLFATTNSYENR